MVIPPPSLLGYLGFPGFWCSSHGHYSNGSVGELQLNLSDLVWRAIRDVTKVTVVWGQTKTPRAFKGLWGSSLTHRNNLRQICYLYLITIIL